MPRLPPALLVVVALAAAGCLTPPDEAIEAASVDAPALVAPLVSHTSAGVVPIPAAFAGLAVDLLDTGVGGGEPSIGVTSDGAIFVPEGGPGIARSLDNGLTWEVLPADPLYSPKASLDPWVYVDPLTDRVFNAPLYVACTWMAYSDDKGESWNANPVAGCGIPAHDHQKLTTGPPAEGVSTTGYPNVIYYQYNSFREEGSWVSTSMDGGRTFSVGQAVHPGDCNHSGIAGPVVVAPDGTAYLAKPACESFDIAVSRDSGESWEITGRVDDVGVASALAVTVDMAVDTAGNAYGVWTGGDGLVYLTTSADGGKTWSNAKRVSPPDVTATVFSVVAAGEPGRVAIGYLGTTHAPWDTENAQDAPDDTVWHAYLSFSEDALAEDPVFTSARLTPDDDPVQIGCVWQSGGSNPCRNLLDFIDMVQVDGRPYLVYADGCDACGSASESRRDDTVVAVLQGGPSLLGGVLAPLGGVVETDEATVSLSDLALEWAG